MHQPCYKPADKNYYTLPWVRLHGVKDYYGMAKCVEKFNKVKVTFNFSGILLEQLSDYAHNATEDRYSILTLKDPLYLEKEEKKFIIERFFSVNFERFIRPNRRYLQLYNKKLSYKREFASQEIRDVQALFNLCWFHPYTIKEDRNVKELVLKGKNYTQQDKEYIINKHYEIITQIIPLYKKLLTQKRIEVTITPYHHPIMPLVYDTDVLKDFPYLEKPIYRFSYPSDCLWHLREAKEIFKKFFGTFPYGSWPSEGSVSVDVASLYNKEGFTWIATDEEILFKSLTTKQVSYDAIKNQRHLIYQPYTFRKLNIFFRDRNLSDAISFVYQGWEDPVFAANDLLEHFKRIHYYVKDMLKNNVVTIIMDGENAWEYYKNNAVEFLETAYSALEKSEIISPTTPSEFIEQHSGKSLGRLSSGSWINADFGVWIGSKKNNHCWNILKRIKNIIERSKRDKRALKKAKECFYLLEGSDWFWWNTFKDESGEFKKIFFSYAEKIYHLLGKKPPSYIIKGKTERSEKTS